MKLSSGQKRRLIANAKKVYLGNLALDFSKTKKIIQLPTNGHAREPVSISELFTFMKSNQGSLNVSIAGKTYTATLTQRNENQYSLNLSQPVKFGSPALSIQAVDTYSDQQIAALLSQTSWTIEELPNGDAAISLPLNDSGKELMIGGAGKLDLYRTHLVTLSNIIKKLESEDDLSALLVALATGTGKTFVQALWAEVLYLSDVTGIFGVPDELIPQFIRDLRRLLHDNFVDKILVLGKKDTKNTKFIQAKAALNELQSKQGNIIVADSRRLLDEFYFVLLAAPSDNTFLSIDEQHILMANERRRRRLLKLTDHVLSLFLTATPDEETYRLSGSEPVATMSNRQKEQAGQGRLPKFETLHVPFFTDLNYKHSNWWTWIKNEFWLRLTGVVFPEISSAAQYAIERMPLICHYDQAPDQRHYGPRWNLHVPMARKMLVVVDDNETLVNFMHYLTERDSQAYHIAGKAPPTRKAGESMYSRTPPTVYSKGAFEPNGMAIAIQGIGYAIYGQYLNRGEEIPLWGTDELIAKERAAAWNTVAEQLPDHDTEIMMKEMAEKGMKAQLKANIFHSLIEYVVSDLTGLDTIQLNKMRKYDLPSLLALVKRSCQQPKLAQDYTAQLSKVIDQKGAEEIGELLSALSGYLHQAIQDHQDEKIYKFVDNWYLDHSIMTELTTEDRQGRYAYSMEDYDDEDDSSSPYLFSQSHANFAQKFRTYSRRYLIMAVMENMDNDETPITDSRPFVKLNATKQEIFDKNKRFNKQAKPRQRHSIQILLGAGHDDIFSPEYLDISEEQAEQYFRLGFTTLISNKKHKGYSDLNLHSVLNLAEQTVNPNNSPEVTIQASGRNRGLDETVVPFYLHVLGHRQVTHFYSTMLDKMNYYADFFRAQHQYNDACIDLLGINLAKRIKTIYLQHKGEEATPIDADALHADITQEIAKYLRDINNRNSHNIVLSRKLLTRVVAKAMTELEKEINNLRNPYNLSPTIVFLAKMIVAGSQAFHYLLNFSENRKIKQKLDQHMASIQAASNGPHDDVFLKMVRQVANITDLASNGIQPIFQELLNDLRAIQRRADPKKSLPAIIKKTISNIENQASRYGYDRDKLLIILSYSATERRAKLSYSEKQMLLPRLEQFETLLSKNGFTNEEFMHALDWQNPNVDQGLTELSNVITELQRFVNSSNSHSSVHTQMIDRFATILTNENVRLLCQNLEQLTSEDCAALLQSSGYANATAGAQRISAFRAIVKSQNVQDFKQKFLTPVAAMPILTVLRECSLCADALAASHQSFTARRFDDAYLAIIRNINKTDLIASVAPAMELFAWVKKKAMPLRNALYKKLIELNVPEFQLRHMLNLNMDSKQSASMPKAIKEKVTAFENLVGFGYESTLLNNLFQSVNDLPSDIAEEVKEIESLLDEHDISLTEFRELLRSNRKSAPKEAKLFSDIAQVFALFSFLMNHPDEKEQTIDFVLEHLSPIIFHSQVAEMFNSVLKKLSRENLIAIVEAETGVSDPKAADRLIALNTILQKKDLQKLRTEFLYLRKDQTMENMPLFKVLQECGMVIEAVMSSHTHFTRFDFQGSPIANSRINSSFLAKISPNLRGIQLPIRANENRTNMAKGAIRSFANLAKVGGDANKDDIRFLSRIKNHILRPIWWTSSLSKWAFSFIETAKTVAFWLRDKGFVVWNKIRQLHAWVRGHNQVFQPSVKSEMSMAYNQATFAAVRELNELRPFSPLDVEKADCPKDTIVKFEYKTRQRKARQDDAPVPSLLVARRQNRHVMEEKKENERKSLSYELK